MCLGMTLSYVCWFNAFYHGGCARHKTVNRHVLLLDPSSWFWALYWLGTIDRQGLSTSLVSISPILLMASAFSLAMCYLMYTGEHGAGKLKDILCEDNTILWILKLCSCVSVRLYFMELVWWLKSKTSSSGRVRNKNFTTRFQSHKTPPPHQFTNRIHYLWYIITWCHGPYTLK